MLQFGVNEWVTLFTQIGLSEEQMRYWHELFEKNYPEAHESFLTWLGLSPERIAEIRVKSR